MYCWPLSVNRTRAPRAGATRGERQTTSLSETIVADVHADPAASTHEPSARATAVAQHCGHRCAAPAAAPAHGAAAACPHAAVASSAVVFVAAAQCSNRQT